MQDSEHVASRNFLRHHAVFELDFQPNIEPLALIRGNSIDPHLVKCLRDEERGLGESTASPSRPAEMVAC